MQWSSKSRHIFLENISSTTFHHLCEIIGNTNNIPEENKICVNRPTIGFSRFQGGRILADALFRNNTDAQLHQSFLKQIESLPLSEEKVGFSYEDSIIQAVVRRISRESHHSSLVIDHLSRILLQRIQNLSKKSKDVLIIYIDGFECWDRPSIRLLHRVNSLNIDIQLTWAIRRSDYYPSKNDFENKITQSHRDFVEKFKSLQEEKLTRNFSEYYSHHTYKPDHAHLTLNELATELAYQNFEQVYLLAKTLLNKTHYEKPSHVYRLLGLTEANKGDYDQANMYLERAYKSNNSHLWQAHIRYLQGLLFTKRHYDLGKALTYYHGGLRNLKNARDKTETSLERAWLYNGIALTHALRAKRKDTRESEKEITSSFDFEIQAYTLAQLGNDPRFSYLRHNLLANITFLFEIKRDHKKARAFWIKSFEKYLAKHSPTFETAFYVRLGLLEFKSGMKNSAIKTIKKSLKASQKTRDKFYQQRIYYSLGYIEFQSNHYNRAFEYFCSGMKTAYHMREQDSFMNHAIGALWSSALQGNSNRFTLIASLLKTTTVNIALDVQPEATARELLHLLQMNNIVLREPDPKLPSYIPSIDLEGVPSRYLNLFLVGTD